jgi:hypothetical protein
VVDCFHSSIKQINIDTKIDLTIGKAKDFIQANSSPIYSKNYHTQDKKTIAKSKRSFNVESFIWTKTKRAFGTFKMWRWK